MRFIGDDQLAGSDDRLEQGPEVGEDQPVGLVAGKKLPGGFVPGDVGQRMDPQVGMP